MKLEKLTKEQESKLAIYKEKWLNKIFNYELYNNNTFESIRDAMKELYKFCDLKEPIVLFLDSPMACQYAAAMMKDLKLNQVRNQVRNQVGNQVWNQVGNQVENQVRNQVWNIPYEQFSSYINYSDFGWLSFYDFFNIECELIQEFNEKLASIIKFCESSFMQIQLDGLCIVSKYPKSISRNANNDLHNLESPAIIFDDNYNQYYVNGVYVEESLFLKLKNKEYSFDEWTKEENEEIKSIVLAYYEEAFGGEYVFNFLSTHLKEINTYVDKKEEKYLKGTVGMNVGVYTLFKGNVNNTDIAYVRCYCPSTDRMFFLGVHPDMSNAKDAIASLCQIPLKLKDNLTEIRRQGECFSFNFDDYGTQLLKNKMLTEEDFREVVSLQGDEYFSKIKFEY